MHNIFSPHQLQAYNYLDTSLPDTISKNKFKSLFIAIINFRYNDLTNLSAIDRKTHNFYQLEIAKRLNEGSIKFSKTIKKNFNEIVSDNFTYLSRVDCPKGIKISSLGCLGKLTNLTHLNLQGTLITDDALYHLVRLENLTHLNLQGTKVKFKNLTDNFIEDEDEEIPLEQFKKLTHLNLQDTPFEDSGFHYLKTLTTLTHLILRNCTKITSVGVLSLLEQINLTDLDITGCFDNEILEAQTTAAVERVSKLVRWDKKATLLFPMILEFVLTYLSYKDLIQAIADKRIHSFYKYQRLKRLNEGSAVLSDKTIENFNNIINENFPNLLRLKCPINVTDSSLTCLKNLTDLSCLELTGCTNISTISFAHLQRLTHLNLSNSIFDPDLNELASLTNLTHLDLSASGIMDAKLISLPPLTNLTYLNLSFNLYMNAGFNTLARLTNLVHLDLSRNGIRNVDLDLLRPLTQLTTLSLNNSGITDEGVSKLVHSKNLFHLNLDGLSLEDQSLVNLVEKLSNLRELIFCEKNQYNSIVSQGSYV